MRADNLGGEGGGPRDAPAGSEGEERSRAAGQGGDAPEEMRRPEPPNLFDLLRTRVRAASDGQLVIAASLGVAGLVTLGVVRRWPWAAIAACGALLGAGLWGVLDRAPPVPALLGRAVPSPLLSVARVASGFIALLSLLALMLGAFGLCLGPWIS